MDMKKVVHIFSALIFWGNLCLVVYGILDAKEAIPVFWALTWSVLMIFYMILVVTYYVRGFKH
ncbi:hypothetical protein ABPH35_08880 [Streptococcus sp. ZJ93]|uniref:hypothetical protein n=1 Tax=Streptococcus handemini TaxID=3161188 RepID=UPI0032F08ED0